MPERRENLIAVYLPSLTGGGAQINALRLAGWLVEDGFDVDLVVHDRRGHVSDRVPTGARIVELARSSEPWTRLHMLWAARRDRNWFFRSIFQSRKKLEQLRYLPSLCGYLRRNRPHLVLSNLWQPAINLVTARALAAPEMPVACIFRAAYFFQCAQDRATSKRPRKWRLFFDYCRCVYNKADAIVTVSHGVANDLSDIVGVSSQRIRAIHNPSASPEVTELAKQDPAHPWFVGSGPPVVLAVGRLSPEKRFDVLIDAYARVRDQGTTARLLILGDGMDREKLETLARDTGYSTDIAMPGWDDNPYAYMQRCGLFVLCSQTEGLPTALIEAMACGAPVIAYDCPHGPREILDDGRYGQLVPMNDSHALTQAIQQTLDTSVDRERLKDRARVFSPANSAAGYRRLIEELLVDDDAERSLAPEKRRRLEA